MVLTYDFLLEIYYLSVYYFPFKLYHYITNILILTSTLEPHISLKEPQIQFLSSPEKRPFFNLREVMIENQFQN